MEDQILPKINSPEDLRDLDEKDIKQLSGEIRAFLCEKVSKNGGHLASNLGIVELTIALHRVFDSPKDHIIFDVGHQSYVHKILTGRKNDFDRLRMPGYLSGFTNRFESEHDPFGAGHASTSVSAGVGFAEADKLNGKKDFTVVVLGDGSYTGGLVHEGLNNIGKDLKLIIVLNENEMSISHNTGLFAKQMSKLRASKNYYHTKRKIANFLTKIPAVGDALYSFISYVKRVLKRAVYGSNYFEELGLQYLGPIDGNDEEKIERLLWEAKLSKTASIVHIKTKKGKGYAPAEEAPSAYHGVPAEGAVRSDNFSEEMGKILCELAEQDDRICAVTAAMADGTGLGSFQGKFPDRFFDVGIAEGHAVTFSAGLAAQKMRPVFAVYSTFLQRAFDNLLHDVALQGVPLTVCVDRASLASSDGVTHHGIYDVSLVNTIPGSVIYSPITYESLRAFLKESIDSPGLKIIRYPNSHELSVAGLQRKQYLLYDFPPDCRKVVMTYGKETNEVLKARKQKDFGIIVLEKLSPYEEIAGEILSLLPETVTEILFAEEGALHGGAGEAFEAFFANYRYRIMAITSLGVGEKDTDYVSSCHIASRDLIGLLQT